METTEGQAEAQDVMSADIERILQELANAPEPDLSGIPSDLRNLTFQTSGDAILGIQTSFAIERILDESAWFLTVATGEPSEIIDLARQLGFRTKAERRAAETRHRLRE